MRDIGLMAEASLRTEGAQRFGAARGDINRTSGVMKRQLSRDARQAETLGPEFGWDPAQYFTGTQAGLNMADIGESRRIERADRSEDAIDRALTEAYRSAQLELEAGKEADWDIINWYMNQLTQDPNVALPDEIAPVVMKELAQANMMDLMMPEPQSVRDQILGQELQAGLSGMSEEQYGFTTQMMSLGLTLPEVMDIWGQASAAAMMSQDDVINEAWRVVAAMDLL